MNELDLMGVKRIVVDETSSCRGHRYITLFVDVDDKTVLFATEGKSKDTLEKFKQYLMSKGATATQIQEICCDMAPSFIRGDKFHVMQMLNEAVDEVRREEQKQASELKNSRYLWLKNASTLKNEQKMELDKLRTDTSKPGKRTA